MSGPTEKSSNAQRLDLNRENAELRKIVGDSEARCAIAGFILNAIPDFAAYVDRDLIYRFCNQSYADPTGHTCEEIVGKHAEDVLGETAMEQIQPYLDQVFAGESVHYEDWVKYEFDSERYVSVLYVPHIVAEEVKGFAVLVRNATAQKRAEEQLKHQASHDPLTGLPNRSLFAEFAEAVLARAKRKSTRAALMFIDLDDFKEVNDRCGHEAGDDALRTVAMRFSNVVRSSDSLARIGGDEFVVMVEDVDDTQAVVTLANRLISMLDEPIETGDRRSRIGASIGISLYPDHGKDVRSLINYADKAMYSAKREGGNRHGFFRKS